MFAFYKKLIQLEQKCGSIWTWNGFFDTERNTSGMWSEIRKTRGGEHSVSTSASKFNDFRERLSHQLSSRFSALLHKIVPLLTCEPENNLSDQFWIAANPYEWLQIRWVWRSHKKKEWYFGCDRSFVFERILFRWGYNQSWWLLAQRALILASLRCFSNCVAPGRPKWTWWIYCVRWTWAWNLQAASPWILQRLVNVTKHNCVSSARPPHGCSENPMLPWKLARATHCRCKVTSLANTKIINLFCSATGP